MHRYEPLEKALEHCFDKYLFELPPTLKRRVLSALPIASLCDDLEPERRRAIARYQDLQHDPQLFDFNEYWFNFYARTNELGQELAKWQRAGVSTASDLQIQQDNLVRLKQELANRQHLEKALLFRKFPHHERSGEDDAYPAIDDRTVWVAFPKPLEILKASLNTTAEELAAWIFMGAGKGGI